jgi:hypothetical protein
MSRSDDNKISREARRRLYRFGPRRPSGMTPYGNEHIRWGETMGGLRTTADGATPSNAKTVWRRLAKKARRAQDKRALAREGTE